MCGFMVWSARTVILGQKAYCRKLTKWLRALDFFSEASSLPQLWLSSLSGTRQFIYCQSWSTMQFIPIQGKLTPTQCNIQMQLWLVRQVGIDHLTLLFRHWKMWHFKYVKILWLKTDLGATRMAHPGAVPMWGRDLWRHSNIQRKNRITPISSLETRES